MLRNVVLSLAALALVAIGQSGTANAAVVVATGSGWVNNSPIANNTNTAVIANTFSGNLGNLYENWFAFNIPNLGTITSATINIWNDGSNFNFVGGATYTLYQASSIDYPGLVSGAVLGSVLTSAANTGISHYEAIPLNATAVALLDAAQGGQFLFGGFNTGDQIFGYTDGTPIAFLELNVTTSAVPEPASLAVWSMVAGLIAVGGIRRRMKRTAV